MKVLEKIYHVMIGLVMLGAFFVIVTCCIFGWRVPDWIDWIMDVEF